MRYVQWKAFKTRSGLKKDQIKCKNNVSKNSQNNTSESANKVNSTTEHQTKIHSWSHSSSYVLLLRIDKIYDKIVLWRKSFFLFPTGSVKKRYIEETTGLTNEWL